MLPFGPIILFGFLLTPSWVALWLVGKLGNLSEPGLRADLAVTPQDPGQYLLRELKLRLVGAVSLPAMIGVVGLAAILASLPRQIGTSSYDEFAAAEVGAMIPFQFVFQAIVAIAAIFNETRRACASGVRMNPWMAGMWSVGVTILFTVLFSGCICLFLWMIAEDDRILGGYGVVPILMLGVFGALMQVLWRTWKGLVRAYLVVEVSRRP